MSVLYISELLQTQRKRKLRSHLHIAGPYACWQWLYEDQNQLRETEENVTASPDDGGGRQVRAGRGVKGASHQQSVQSHHGGDRILY